MKRIIILIILVAFLALGCDKSNKKAKEETEEELTWHYAGVEEEKDNIGDIDLAEIGLEPENVDMLVVEYGGNEIFKITYDGEIIGENNRHIGSLTDSEKKKMRWTFLPNLYLKGDEL